MSGFPLTVNENDIVLDNAFGSGSFLVSAAMEKRKFIGIELNKNVVLHKNQSINLFDVVKNA